MTLQALKESYWSVLHQWNRIAHPTQRVLTPGDEWDAMNATLELRRQRRDQLIYVDGGAHDGVTAMEFDEKVGPLEVHAFEPNPDLQADLRARLDSFDGRVHQVALGSRSETVSFQINQSPMTSSMLARSDYAEKYFDAHTAPLKKVDVPCVTLDDWFADSGLEQVDVLKLDLQGFELEALRGAANMLAAGVGCIFLEVHFVPFYEGSALFADIDTLLRNAGYRLQNLYNIATHLPEGQIGSADALYVWDAPHGGGDHQTIARPASTAA